MREWEPLPQKQLVAIRADTEADCPEHNYCPADVYRLTSELVVFRRLLKELDENLDGVRLPASASPIVMTIRHILAKTER